MSNKGQTNLIALAFIGLLIALSIIPFWPGTSGHFMLDDSPNLSPMSEMGEIDDLDSLRQFIFSGNAGPSGRPVALLSFVLDGNTWPTEPYPFKRTSILIHTINTLLLFGALLSLFTLLKQPQRQALTIAFASALLWAIHPLHVSTVLYVVQRMAELPALFILAALWCYLHGRRVLAHNPGAGYLWMSSAIFVGGALAFFSKESGILLPLLVLVLEFTLLADQPRPKHWCYWAIPFLGLPVMVILAYFGYVISDADAKFALRDFSLYERLLSESRALVDYLFKLFLPLQVPSVYNDDFPVSRGLFQPFTTVLSLLAIIALLGFALLKRRQMPLLSFAILWFFAAHLLESTVLPLEIYFEHRNYLALAGPALLLGYHAQRLITQNKKLYLPAGLLLLGYLMAISLNHSTTWGDPAKLAVAWNEQHPGSVRARTNYMLQQLQAGDIPKALELAEATHEAFPQHLGAKLVMILNRCLNDKLGKEEIIDFMQSAQTLPMDDIVAPNMKFLARTVLNQTCVQIRPQGAERFVDALLNNPNKRVEQEYVLYLIKSEINYALRRFESTVEARRRAFEIVPSINTAIRIANIAASAGRYQLAQHHLRTALALNASRNPLLPSREEELKEMQHEFQLQQQRLINSKAGS